MPKKVLIYVCALFLAGCAVNVDQNAINTENDTYNHSDHGCDAFEECSNGTIAADDDDFKTSYESFNGRKTRFGKVYRTITIAENHPFVKVSDREVIERMDSGESFYLYIGDAKCPWCRAVIETAIVKAREHGISEILYLPIWDEEGNEILRDKYELINGRVEQKVSGTEGYYELLKRFDSVLDVYKLTDADTHESKSVEEKRIYAPSFFKITNGDKDITMITGIPENLDDPWGELSDEQYAEMSDAFRDFFS